LHAYNENPDFKAGEAANQKPMLDTSRIIADTGQGIAEVTIEIARLRGGFGQPQIKDDRKISLGEDGRIQLPFVSKGMSDHKDKLKTENMFEQPMQIKSAVVHEGGGYGGHYVTYARDAEDSSKWYKISDSFVTEVTKQQAFDQIETNATLLQFEKSAAPKKWSASTGFVIKEFRYTLPEPKSWWNFPLPSRGSVNANSSPVRAGSKIPAFLGFGTLIIAPFVVGELIKDAP